MASLNIKINSAWRTLDTAEGRPVLDLLRNDLGLTSTKEGCREGDCGACAVLVGERIGGEIRYRAVPSCLLASGELRGKHLITLEGLVEGVENGLTPVMRAFLENNASQCGFCTPGFIIALTSWLAETATPDLAGALRAVDGNLCRCTGYGAIRRAAASLVQRFENLPLEQEPRLRALVKAEVLPPSVLEFIESSASSTFSDTREKTHESEKAEPRRMRSATTTADAIVGGGTDYYVRNPDPEEGFAPLFTRMMPDYNQLKYVIDENAKWLEIGSAVTVSDFFASPLVRREVPGIERFETAFASTLIRNLATVGGNIVNASPVADITSMLLALGTVLVISPANPSRSKEDSNRSRLCPLEKFFLGYKKLDLRPGEVLRALRIPVCGAPTFRRFSFEKASKRKNLDIAAVNTAISFSIEDGVFRDVRVSLGGVAPIPSLGVAAMDALEGAQCRVDDRKSLAALARKVADVAAGSVNPIGDVRGSADYRRRMVRQLMLAHFVRLFESSGIAEELFP